MDQPDPLLSCDGEAVDDVLDSVKDGRPTNRDCHHSVPLSASTSSSSVVSKHPIVVRSSCSLQSGCG
jgi:hypothetical protein